MDGSPAQAGHLHEPARGLLDWVERIGNRLPDPVAIFVVMIGVLVAVSVIGSWAGWSAVHPVTGEALAVKNLLSEELVARFLGEMTRTYTGFAPLGMVLVLLLGAGVAEQAGLFSALLRKMMGSIPDALMNPAVILVGLLGSHMGDSNFLIVTPLAGLLYGPRRQPDPRPVRRADLRRHADRGAIAGERLGDESAGQLVVPDCHRRGQRADGLVRIGADCRPAPAGMGWGNGTGAGG